MLRSFEKGEGEFVSTSGLGGGKSWVRIVPTGFELIFTIFLAFKKGEGVSALLLAIFLRKKGSDSPFFHYLIHRILLYCDGIEIKMDGEFAAGRWVRPGEKLKVYASSSPAPRGARATVVVSVEVDRNPAPAPPRASGHRLHLLING